jgi:hypothetical protein
MLAWRICSLLFLMKPSMAIRAKKNQDESRIRARRGKREGLTGAPQHDRRGS